MTRGRKPKPTKLKQLQGNPGKRALNKKEPQPAVEIPDCPVHLEGDARTEWKRVTQELQTMGMISRLDRAALAAYCSAYGDYVRACRMVKEHGEIGVTAKGYEFQSVWLQIKKRSMDQIVRYAAEFGMTPSSRARVRVESPDEEDVMASFLFGQRAKVTK